MAGRLPAETANAPEKVVPAPGTEVASELPDAPAVVPAEPIPATVVPAAPAPTPTVEPAPDAEAIFGLEHKQKPKEERPDELQLKWTKKKKDAYGKWIVTLENGQVWRQTDSTRFSFKNTDQWVIIARGAVGGFFLGEPDRNKRIRVKRVK
ncbi:hypothetical protein GCM10025776_30490 [Corallincola platygyrae]